MEEKTYWAWRDDKEEEFRHIYKRRFQVEMCSPDGFRQAEKRGDGKLVEVKVTEYRR